MSNKFDFILEETKKFSSLLKKKYQTLKQVKMKKNNFEGNIKKIIMIIK